MSDHVNMPPGSTIEWPTPDSRHNLMVFQSVLVGKKVIIFWKDGCYDANTDGFYEGTVERVLELAGEVWLLTGPEGGDNGERVLARLDEVDSFTIGEQS